MKRKNRDHEYANEIEKEPETIIARIHGEGKKAPSIAWEILLLMNPWKRPSRELGLFAGWWNAGGASGTPLEHAISRQR